MKLIFITISVVVCLASFSEATTTGGTAHGLFNKNAMVHVHSAIQNLRKYIANVKDAMKERMAAHRQRYSDADLIHY